MGDVKEKVKSFEKLKPVKFHLVGQNNNPLQITTQNNLEIVESFEYDDISNIEKEEPEKEIKLNEFEPVNSNKTHSYCYFLCEYCQDIRNIVDQYQ